MSVIIKQDFSDTISEKYLSYALSTIMSRSLPDLRDGLKPVHRRLIYAMHELRLNPESGFKKCARIVGDVIGKYHPHGDVAVYDALVRMAQQFSLRYPLIDGQGNFGSVDGDNAAAMRYTESKLTEAAILLTSELKSEVVSYSSNYDGSEEEPTVLPAIFPNILANGAEGIAVGMATNIPPHNILELLNALITLSKKPELTEEELIEIIPAPDFPTGGVINETKQHLKNIYSTGKGGIKLRCKWHKEDLGNGQYQIIVTEIPYQVNKSKLIEKIAELLKDKKLPLLENISDESAEDIRIVFEPKNRNIDADILMAMLFKYSDLEIRYNINLNVLSNGVRPQLMSLKDIMLEFLEFRREIITKRSNFRIKQIKHRLEILSALLITYLNLDRVIAIIREYDEPKQQLMSEFNLNDIQAESILNTKLRSLRKLEEFKIKEEEKQLNEELGKLQNIVNNKQQLEKTLVAEIKNTIKFFEKDIKIAKRRTEINHELTDITEINNESFINREAITVVISEKEWIKSLKGHATNKEKAFKDGENIVFALEIYTTDKVILITDQGKFYTLSGDKIPGGKGPGEPIRIHAEMAPDEKLVDIFKFNEQSTILLASTNNKAFVVEMRNCLAQTKGGKQVMNVSAGHKLFKCLVISDSDDYVASIGENRKLLIFPFSQLPKLNRGQGVTIQKYKDGTISDIVSFDSKEGLKYGYNRILTEYTGYFNNRATAGRIAPLGMPRDNKFYKNS